MYISEGEFDYASLDGIKIIRMPYNGDRLSMLVILPNGRDGIGSLEETISAEQIEQWTQSMRKEKKGDVFDAQVYYGYIIQSFYIPKESRND